MCHPEFCVFQIILLTFKILLKGRNILNRNSIWIFTSFPKNYNDVSFTPLQSITQLDCNQPEWMPLDISLNNDIQSTLSLHCAITAHLDNDDIRKFSFSTPSTIVSGIRSIYNNGASSNVPLSRYIV